MKRPTRTIKRESTITLRGRWIPNRGWVMAHQKGDRAHCNRLRAQGRDLLSTTAPGGR